MELKLNCMKRLKIDVTHLIYADLNILRILITLKCLTFLIFILQF